MSTRPSVSLRAGPQYDRDHAVFFVGALLVHRRGIFETGRMRDGEAGIDLALFDQFQE